MTRLNEKIHEELSKTVLQKLFAKSIFTTIEFLQTDTGLLSNTTGLPYSKISLLKNELLKKFSSPLSRGHDYYKEVLKCGAIISTGIKSLDDLLNGGLCTGNLYEICGLSASGKTQLCMSMAANISAILVKQSILYVDTKNDVSTTRLYEIIKGQQNKIRDVNVLMLKIKICRIKNAYELLSLLHKINQELKINKDENQGFRLIIIDSLTALFHHFLGELHNEGLCLLNNIANILNYIATDFHIIILVTNLVTSWTLESNFNVVAEEENSFSLETQITKQPALGKYWAHVPNTRIMMQKLNIGNEYLLTILKSSNEPVGKTIKVSICNEGLV